MRRCYRCDAVIPGRRPKCCPFKRCGSRAFYQGESPRSQSVAGLMDEQPAPLDAYAGLPAVPARRRAARWHGPQ